MCKSRFSFGFLLVISFQQIFSDALIGNDPLSLKHLFQQDLKISMLIIKYSNALYPAEMTAELNL